MGPRSHPARRRGPVPLNIAILAGGTGGAALASGIHAAAPQHRLTVIANTGDDDEFWGLYVCPDVDAVIYRLAGAFNEHAGYGMRADTFTALDALAQLGEPAWFRIGDRDLATHVFRTSLLHAGRTLTEATLELCRRFHIDVSVLPMTDDRVRTRFDTDAGDLSFQEYFVRERLRPRLRAVKFAGVEHARPSPQVVEAVETADAVIIGPSNPLISIEPILDVVRDHLRRDRTIAVTPIVAGAALKGPTVEMMRALGVEPTPVAVAAMYRDVAGCFVLDERDRELAPEITALGVQAIVCDTVMTDGGKALGSLLLRHV